MVTIQTRPIRSELSTQRLLFESGGEPACFTVTVYNDSPNFAAFRLSLKAPGVEDSRAADWYRLVPSVSSKIPSGDYTQFIVQIFAPPPADTDFSGSMMLKTIVSSIDLDRQEDRQDLELLISGNLFRPLIASLNSSATLDLTPGDAIELIAEIKNPNRQTLKPTLQIPAPYSTWFENPSQIILLEPNQPKLVYFRGRIPEGEASPIATLYPVPIQITQANHPPTQLETAVQILPTGEIEFIAKPKEAQLPEQAYQWLNPLEATATYNLTVENRSNQPITTEIKLYNPIKNQWKWPWTGYSLPWKKQPEIDLEPVDEKLKGLTPAENIQFSPSPIESIKTYHAQDFDLEVTRKLPWLGWSRREKFEAHLTLLEGDRPIQEEIQYLDLGILPVIPFWLQMTGGAFLLAIILLLLKLFPSGHTEPVNTVQFNGQGTEVLSGSNDQTIRRWAIEADHLTSRGVLLKEGKAIRTVKFRPVNNDEIAAGLENGEVRVANLLQRDDVRLGSLNNADRVFDLVFSRDSRQMYSAHGSGQVIPWSVDIRDGNGLAAEQPIQPAQPFAISAISLLGEQEDLIAIGGRYNRLTIIDPAKKQSFEVPYQAGGQEDYIKSFAIAQQQPDLLANSDNRGNILLWDFSTCRKNLKNCQPITQWTGHGGQSVNAVKLTNDGCFLASAGSDGQAKLWAMDGRGNRRSQNANEGKVLFKAKKPLNSIDIIRKQDHLLVVTGGDDHRVNLQRIQLKRSDRRSANVCSNVEIK